MEPLDLLNKISLGWTQCGTILVNPSLAGGIIDVAIVSKEWFVIFNDDRNTKEGFSSLNDAIEYFAAASITND